MVFRNPEVPALSILQNLLTTMLCSNGAGSAQPELTWPNPPGGSPGAAGGQALGRRGRCPWCCQHCSCRLIDTVEGEESQVKKTRS